MYWAAKEPRELAAYLDSRIGEWNKSTDSQGLKTLWRKCYQAYYGRHWRGAAAGASGLQGQIQHMGEEGELSGLTVNDFRNLIKHMLVLVTNQAIAYAPRASNTDDDSLIQARLAKNFLEYYAKEKRFKRHLYAASELALFMGSGFIKHTWDKQAGKPYAVEENEDGTKRLVYEGDIKIKVLNRFEVFWDLSEEHWDNLKHIDTIEWENKYDLAARYPEFAAKILSLPTKNMIDGIRGYYSDNRDDTDLIAVKEFFHVRTDALPNGRYLKRLSDEIVLEDLPIPYTKIPVSRIVPSMWHGTCEGYSEAFDILNLQQAENVVWSTIYTNLQTYGIQNILIPDGANLTRLQLAKGLQGLKYNPSAGKPEGLNMVSIPPEAFKLADMLNSKMETVFGMNSVARGNPESEMSGKALGLLQAMAIQYASSFQESYAQLAEDIGTATLSMINDFAETERVAALAGKFNKADVIKVKRGSFNAIERAVVELDNAANKTLPMKLEMAQTLIQNGMIKDAQQYIQVLETGNLETMTEAPMSEMSLIRSENEKMSAGEPVIVLKTDNHSRHASEHLVLLSRPDVRANSSITQIVLEHIAEHEALWFQESQNPFHQLITGEPPAPMPPPGMPGGEMPPDMAPPGPQQGMPEPANLPPSVTPPGPDEALQQALQ